jgi:PAS domain S-box-containing protein
MAQDEIDRIAGLLRYDLLDTPAEQQFDDAVLLLRGLCDVPIALVSLVDGDRQWFKASSGVDVRETPRDTSVCSLAIQGTELFEIPDLTLDPRTAEMALVQGPAHLRFYAGAPLITSDGIALGSLCAIDTVPRPLGLTGEQRDALLALGRHVTAMIEMRLTIAHEEVAQIDREAVESRSSALLELADRLRNSRNIADMVHAAATISGAALALNRAGYGTLDETCDHAEIDRDWHVEGLETIAGRHVMRSYGDYIDDLLRGETLAVSDVREDERLLGSGFDPLGIRALLNVPVTEHGRLVALFYLTHGEPHDWSQAEIAFAHDVAERTRQAVERLRAEGQLRELASTLEHRVRERTQERDRLWRNSQDAQIVIDGEGVFLEVNPAFTRILGWAPEEVVGRSAFDFILPDDEDVSNKALQLARHDVLPTIENRYRHKDGGHRWFSWVAAPEGGLIYASGRHVTAEKEQAEALIQTEEALRQAQKMEAVGQLTGGLAHDFNNLLTGMMGNLELLQARIARGRFEDVDRFVNAAQGAGRRAAALTQRLLAFSRRQTLDPRPTDVNRLITGMEELLRRTVGPVANIEVVGAAGLWPALIDPGQLENALLNLCINARDAMPDGGRLTIETANKWLDERAAKERDLPAGQYISICVTDTGSGMSPEVVARAFDPFFTTKPIGEGTGLGLSMIYGFARQSGGQVRIYTEVGKGTTMCIYLPRHYGDADGASGVDEVPTVRAGGGQTILLVDDEATIRHLVDEVLDEVGYTVIGAADGAAGLKVLQSGARIELLITDVGLPNGMNGRQVADAARSLRPGLKVLFITGYAENAAVGNGHLEPGMELLTKPFSMEALTRKVQDMLAAK